MTAEEIAAKYPAPPSEMSDEELSAACAEIVMGWRLEKRGAYFAWVLPSNMTILAGYWDPATDEKDSIYCGSRAGVFGEFATPRERAEACLRAAMRA